MFEIPFLFAPSISQSVAAKSATPSSDKDGFLAAFLALLSPDNGDQKDALQTPLHPILTAPQPRLIEPPLTSAQHIPQQSPLTTDLTEALPDQNREILIDIQRDIPKIDAAMDSVEITVPKPQAVAGLALEKSVFPASHSDQSPSLASKSIAHSSLGRRHMALISQGAFFSHSISETETPYVKEPAPQEPMAKRPLEGEQAAAVRLPPPQNSSGPTNVTMGSPRPPPAVEKQETFFLHKSTEIKSLVAQSVETEFTEAMSTERRPATPRIFESQSVAPMDADLMKTAHELSEPETSEFELPAPKFIEPLTTKGEDFEPVPFKKTWPRGDEESANPDALSELQNIEHPTRASGTIEHERLSLPAAKPRGRPDISTPSPIAAPAEAVDFSRPAVTLDTEYASETDELASDSSIALPAKLHDVPPADFGPQKALVIAARPRFEVTQSSPERRENLGRNSIPLAASDLPTEHKDRPFTPPKDIKGAEAPHSRMIQQNQRKPLAEEGSDPRPLKVSQSPLPLIAEDQTAAKKENEPSPSPPSNHGPEIANILKALPQNADDTHVSEPSSELREWPQITPFIAQDQKQSAMASSAPMLIEEKSLSGNQVVTASQLKTTPPHQEQSSAHNDPVSTDETDPEVDSQIFVFWQEISTPADQIHRFVPLSPAARAPVAALHQIIKIITAKTPSVTEISLQPKDLGKITITFSGDFDALSVHLVPEKPETLELLRRHGDRLMSDLRHAGYQEVTLNFGNPKSKDDRRSQRSLILEELRSNNPAKREIPPFIPLARKRSKL